MERLDAESENSEPTDDGAGSHLSCPCLARLPFVLKLIDLSRMDEGVQRFYRTQRYFGESQRNGAGLAQPGPGKQVARCIGICSLRQERGRSTLWPGNRHGPICLFSSPEPAVRFQRISLRDVLRR